MIDTPSISVILPAYNAEKHLKEAVESILNQTFRDFEFIIINDSSTDGTESIINQFSDSRIVYVKNEQNLGLIATLNKGIALSKGKYIARMDADDISHPERFKKQITVMESDVNIAICSTFRQEFSERVKYIHKITLPVTDEEIRIMMAFNSPFSHPSVIIRKSVLKDNNIVFDHDYKYAEDYEMWFRVMGKGLGYNIPDFLVGYRVHNNSQTAPGDSLQDERYITISTIQEKVLKQNDIVITEKEKRLHYYLSLSSQIKKINFEEYDVPFIKAYFEKLQTAFSKKYTHKAVNKILGKIYLNVYMYNLKRLNVSQLTKLFNFRLFYGGVRSLEF